MQAANSMLVDQQQRKIWNQLTMTPMVRRTVHCLLAADVLFLVALKVV